MKLKEYLKDKNKAEFARAINISPSAVTRLCNGERFPSPALIKRIEKETGDAVRVADWFDNV